MEEMRDIGQTFSQMARARPSQGLTERRFAQLLSFANDLGRFCRNRHISLAGWVPWLHDRVRSELSRRVLDHEAGKVYMRLTDPRFLKAMRRGHPTDSTFLEAVRRGRATLAAKGAKNLSRLGHYVMFGVLHELPAKRQKAILKELDGDGWFAVTTHHKAPSQEEWAELNLRWVRAEWQAARKRQGQPEREPTDRELKALAAGKTRQELPSLKDYLVVELQRYQWLGPKMLDRLPPAARTILEPVCGQLDESIFEPWALCDICRERFTVRERRTEDCHPCRRRFPAPERWAMRLVLKVLTPRVESTDPVLNMPPDEGGTLSDVLKAIGKAHRLENVRVPRPSASLLDRALRRLLTLGRVQVSGDGTDEDPQRWRLATGLRSIRARKRRGDLTHLLSPDVPLLTDNKRNKGRQPRAADKPLSIPQSIPTPEEVRRRTKEILRRAAPSSRWVPRSRIPDRRGSRAKRERIKRFVRIWY